MHKNVLKRQVNLLNVNKSVLTAYTSSDNI